MSQQRKWHFIITIQINAQVKATMHHGAWFHTPGELSPLLDNLTIPPALAIASLIMNGNDYLSQFHVKTQVQTLLDMRHGVVIIITSFFLFFHCIFKAC